MTAVAEIVHRMPGRIRLRVPERRGDEAYFSALSEQISRLDGISHAKANPRTGSIVIEFFDDERSMMQELQNQGLSIEQRVISPPRKNDQSRPFSTSDDDVEPFHIVSNRDINPMFMLGTLLAAVGIVQTFRGKILVPSLSVLWYAMEAFQRSKISPTKTIDTEGNLAGR